MQVIPTLLTTTKDECIHQMNTFQRLYKRLQLDIADGNLVPNITVQIDEIIELQRTNMVSFFPSVEFDFHLMVKDFENEFKKIQKLQENGMKINTVLVNADLHPDIPSLLLQYQFAIGIDVFPHTQIDDLARHYDLEQISTIQIMTVNPGFQGSPFLPNMLTKIEQLRVQNYKGIIMIDGGVNGKTIPIISSKKYQPDFLCIGSYLTQAGDELGKRVQTLTKL